MSKTILEVKDVCLDYTSKTGIIHALDNISFNIEEHDFICVLGPSGCGKSTLLKLIAGFEHATKGALLLNGEKIDSIDCHRGVVFQKDNLFEWFNVRNNINYGLRMRGELPKEEIEAKTNAMLELMGLADFADKKVYELSGGMRQRVSIGRTLINDPKILLMDEPFSALDALTREQLQDALRSLWVKQKNTIFFITHDIDEALVMGTRIIVLSSRPGRIVKNMPIDYTNRIYAAGNSRRVLEKDYFELRRELFDLISANN